MARIAFFQTHRFERDIFHRLAREADHHVTFFEPRLTSQTASLAQGHNVVCSFVNDQVDRATLEMLNHQGVCLLALRCAGFNHVDLHAAYTYHIPVVRVPAYSPYAVAEHTACLLLALNRKIHKAYMRVLSQNFSLDGLVGFDLHGKTVGVIGTGQIGSAFINIMRGFGCRILAHDVIPDPHIENFATYTDLDDLYSQSDVISLHVPLTPDTHHMLHQEAFHKMKRNPIILNTGRGALIDSKALIDALKKGLIRGAGLDVYEEEESVFFEDLSDQILQDDVLARLLTFPNTIITSHQGFLTQEALTAIAKTTLENIRQFEAGEPLVHAVSIERVTTR